MYISTDKIAESAYPCADGEVELHLVYIFYSFFPNYIKQLLTVMDRNMNIHDSITNYSTCSHLLSYKSHMDIINVQKFLKTCFLFFVYCGFRKNFVNG